MADDHAEQARRLAGGNTAALLPARTAPSRRNACTASSGWPPRSACSGDSASTRASPATSPPATPSCTDHFWVNPFGMDFSHIRVSRPASSSTTHGEVVEGDAAA